MQISKLMPAICAVAVCASLISARAQDNPAQAAARAALLEKMNELDAQQARPAAPIVVTPSGATVVVPPPVLATEPTNPPTVSTPIETPEPAPTVAEPSMKPVGNEETTENPDAQKKAVLASEQKAADAQEKADEQKAAQAKKAAALAEKKRLADEAAEEKAAKIQKQKQAEAEKQRAEAEKAAESAANTGTELGLKPIQAPALPISAGHGSWLCSDYFSHLNSHMRHVHSALTHRIRRRIVLSLDNFLKFIPSR